MKQLLVSNQHENQDTMTEFIPRKPFTSKSFEDHDALSDIAEQTFIQMATEEQAVTAILFKELTYNDRGVWRCRQIPVMDLLLIDQPIGIVKQVIKKLIEAGLLVVTSVQWTIGIVSDNLLTTWKRLHEWLEERYAHTVVSYRYMDFTLFALQWQDWGEPDTHLLNDPKWGELLNWANQHKEHFPPEAQRYITRHQEKAIAKKPPKSKRHVPDSDPVLTLARAKKSIRSAIFNKDGTKIISVGRDAIIRISDGTNENRVVPGDPEEFALLNKIDPGLWLESVAISPNNRIIAYARGNSVSQWDIITKSARNQSFNHDDKVWDVKFSHDGNYLVTACADGIVRVFNLRQNNYVIRLEGHTQSVRSVTFAPPTESGVLRAASGSMDATVRIWSVTSRQEEAKLKLHQKGVGCVGFNSTGHLLISASNDGTAILWSIETHEPVHVLQGHKGSVRAARISNDDRLIATAGADYTVRVWSLDTGRQLKIFNGHTGNVWSVEFSPDSSQLVSAGADRTVRVWDISRIS